MRFPCVFLFIVLPALSAGAQASNNTQCEAESSKPAPSPGAPLEGATNYWFVAQPTASGNCTSLASPSVTITITSDMSSDSMGFDFQYNVAALASAQYPNGANAGGGAGLVGWQQYIINVYSSSDASNRTDIFGMVNNWPTTPPSGPCTKNYSNGENCDESSDLINTRVTGEIFHLVTLENTPIPTLPAGTVLTITLDTDPNNSLDVTGVTFNVTVPSSVQTVVDPKYTYYNGQEISLIGLPLDPSICKGNPPDSRYCPAGFKYNSKNPVSPGNVTPADTSPVTSFTLNIANDQSVPTGAGKLTYAATNGILVPVATWPQDCAAGAVTGETSDYTYSPLKACTTGSLVQPFQSQYCGSMPTGSNQGGTLVCGTNSPTCVAGPITYQYIGTRCPANTVPRLSGTGWSCSTPSLPSCSVRCVTSYTCVPATGCDPPRPGCSVPVP
jgi:hypothetical protein